MSAIRRFKTDLSGLSDNERRVLDKLIQAAELVGPLYEKQENDQYPGSNLYPPDATKEEIKKAAQEDPAILSPFTVVERDSKGNLVAIPYHEKYEEDLRSIAKFLGEAASISEDGDFARYLKARAKAILTDEYEEAVRLWLSMPESKLDFVVGPIERYLDKLFFAKTAYEGHIHILDPKATERCKKIREVLCVTRESIPAGVKKVPPKWGEVQIRADYTPIFAGWVSRIVPTGQHLPNELEFLEKYGSKLSVYLSSLEYKFERFHYPIFEALFAKEFRRRYPQEVLFKGSMFNILLHELSHLFHKYENSEKRLENLFPVFDELNAWVSGIRSCRHLIMKGVISQLELEAIIVMHICRAFTDLHQMKDEKEITDYARGYATALNLYLKEGALQEKGGLSWPNFSKMFFTIETISDISERILSGGSHEDGQRFLDKYYALPPLRRFEDKLKDIPTRI